MRRILPSSVPSRWPLSFGVAAAAAVAQPDVEHAVGPEREVAAVVVRRTAGRRTRSSRRGGRVGRARRRSCTRRCGCRRPCRCSGRTGGAPSGEKATPRRPCSPPVRHQRRRCRARAWRRAAPSRTARDPARLLDDVERVVAGRRDRDRLVSRDRVELGAPRSSVELADVGVGGAGRRRPGCCRSGRRSRLVVGRRADCRSSAVEAAGRRPGPHGVERGRRPRDASTATMRHASDRRADRRRTRRAMVAEPVAAGPFGHHRRP